MLRSRRRWGVCQLAWFTEPAIFHMRAKSCGNEVPQFQCLVIRKHAFLISEFAAGVTYITALTAHADYMVQHRLEP